MRARHVIGVTAALVLFAAAALLALSPLHGPGLVGGTAIAPRYDALSFQVGDGTFVLRRLPGAVDRVNHQRGLALVALVLGAAALALAWSRLGQRLAAVGAGSLALVIGVTALGFLLWPMDQPGLRGSALEPRFAPIPLFVSGPGPQGMTQPGDNAENREFVSTRRQDASVLATAALIFACVAVLLGRRELRPPTGSGD